MALIVIEGLDGCGKSTQLEILKEKYSGKAKFISFPNYDSDSGRIIKTYLSGGFEEKDGSVGAYSASSFYSIDRYISYKTDWEKDYLSSKNIVTARYTGSNAIYQMTKLDSKEWDNYLYWLDDMEFNKFKLPRPDLVIFLDMPTEISQKLLSARYSGDENKKDIHERNVEFLKQCRASALYTAGKQDWKIISCAKDGVPLGIEEISRQITEITDKFFED